MESAPSPAVAKLRRVGAGRFWYLSTGVAFRGRQAENGNVRVGGSEVRRGTVEVRPSGLKNLEGDTNQELVVISLPEVGRPVKREPRNGTRPDGG